MKALVFGGGGFLGSHVSDMLSNAGHDVTIFDCVPSKYLRSGQKQIIGDILNEQQVLDAVRGNEIVYNFAGLSDIREAALKPLDTVKLNIYGNAVILEACRVNKIKRFVFASSLYVYSNVGSFYRSSKQACELFIQDYHEEFGLEYTILRFGSLYGPRADEKNGVYRLIKEALSQKRITYYGTGEEIREYIHVLDAAKLCADILDKNFINQHIIITGNQTIKSKDVLVMIKEMVGGELEIQLKAAESNIHYRVTPYSFNPRIGRKLTANSYVDIGQGILDMMAEIYEEVHKELKSENGILVKPANHEK